ncbi:uncharacterized protein LOC114536764 [Dendronephthya gigantea]|uniref:uncharacterized protein LOC114536764 n=1 Tax=Dendronephthya gigantea TaxID=151771 RepID=UPI00106C0F26|nr:uncharacterized protein LOC114536764 [Dendronephthya gigantea]
MSLLNYFGLIVFLHCSTAIYGHETSTNNINTNCTVDLQESKFMGDLIKPMLAPTINTIEITVTFASANKTRNLLEMKWSWANEIGRTLISLVARTKSTVFDSPLFTYPLEAGIRKIFVKATEDPIGCLPSGKNGSDIVFNHILKKIVSYIHDENIDEHYKLCRPLDAESYRFKCCGITGGGKLKFCDEYSSIIIKWAGPGGVFATQNVNYQCLKVKAKKNSVGIANNETTPSSNNQVSPGSEINLGEVDGSRDPGTTSPPEEPETSTCYSTSCCASTFRPVNDFLLRSCSYLWTENEHSNPSAIVGDETDAADEQNRAIKFDERTGEAMISRKLYEEVSKIVLPLGDLLFHFFRRVIFVCIYAWILFLVLLLAMESGVSGSIRAIGAIAAILLPFIFDTIYADNKKAQKASTNMATTKILEHILKIKKHENNMIVVELVNCLTENVEI